MTQKTKLRSHDQREKNYCAVQHVQRVEMKKRIDAAEWVKPMCIDYPVTAVVAMITNSLEGAAVIGATIG